MLTRELLQKTKPKVNGKGVACHILNMIQIYLIKLDKQFFYISVPLSNNWFYSKLSKTRTSSAMNFEFNIDNTSYM